MAGLDTMQGADVDQRLGDGGTSTKAVLVTGGGGFLGSSLVRMLLHAGHQVTVVDNFEKGRPDYLPESDLLDVRVHDVRDEAGIRKVMTRVRPSVVFHLAAIHYIPDCERDPHTTWSTNVEGTENVARAAAAANVQHFVFSSTAAVYAPAMHAHREDEPPNPVDVYGRSKLVAEQQVKASLAGRHVEIVRLFNVYGPRETNPHVLPSIIEQLEGGTELKLGHLHTERDYVFVDDVSRCLVALAFSGAVGTMVTNVGTGDGTSVRRLVWLVGRHMGVVPEVVVDPSRLRSVDRPRLVADVARIKSRVVVEPTRLEAGIALTVASVGRGGGPTK